MTLIRKKQKLNPKVLRTGSRSRNVFAPPMQWTSDVDKAAVIRVYRSGLVGRTGYKVAFETHDDKQAKFACKFSAFANTPQLAPELHRGHVYRVRFN